MKNVVIIGHGVAGRLLSEDIRENHPEVKILGFIEDNSEKKLGELGTIDDLEEVVHIYKIDEIIVSIPSADGKLMRRILLKLSNNNIPIKLVPRSMEIIDRNKVLYNQTRDFSCEDFLGRAFKKQDTSPLINKYEGKTVLVTGGAGSIGSEVVQQLLGLRVKKVIVYDNSELGVFNLDQKLSYNGVNKKNYKFIIGNITNKEKINRVVQEEKPNFIFHAAAYKHVYLMENNVDEAIINNVIGTKNIVDAAIENTIDEFIFISTDKVVNPSSIMGSTKKLCEFYIKQANKKKTKFNIVRFGNVINSNGSVLPLFEYQLKSHKRLTVTHKEVKRFFMSIREAAQLVVSSTIQKEDGGIYILNMGELVNIYEIALCLIRSKNLVPDRDIKIDIIGLKKGEKFAEELFTKTEMKNIEKTNMENIFRIKNHDVCPKNIDDVIQDLEKLITIHSTQKELRRYLRNIFPTLS